MLKRSPIATAALCAGLGFGSTSLSAHAQDLTAHELYDLAVELNQGGQPELALQRLRQVDPMDLSDDARRNYYQLLASLDPNTPASTDAPVVTEEAVAVETVEATVADQLAQAADLPASEAKAAYQGILDSADATATEKAVAQARLSQIDRLNTPSNQQAKALIAEATDAIKAGDYEGAKAKLLAAQGKAGSLGFYDQQRIQTRLALVNENLAAQATTEQAQAQVALAVVQDEAPAAEAAVEPTGLSDAQAARVQSLIEEGDTAFDAGEYDAAKASYEQAAEISGGSPELDTKMSQAAMAMESASETPAEPSLLSQHLERRQAIADAYLLRYEERIAASKRAINSGDYAPARDFANGGIEALDEGRTYLSQSQYVTLRESAKTLLENIQLKEQQDTQAALRKAEDERARELATQKAQIEKQKQEQVIELLRRALDLRKQSQYEASLSKAKEALYIDPTNVTAQLMVDSIEADMIIVRGEKLQKKRYIESAYQHLDNAEALIPYQDIVTYPDNWPQITKQRLEGMDSSGGESAATTRTQQILEDTTISTVSFEGMRLATVITFLQSNTGANFVPNWSALELAGVDQDTPITLNMRNVSAGRVLELALQQASTDFEPVSYSVEDGVVVISTETALASATDVRIYDIRDLLLPIYDNFNQAPEFDLQNVGQQQGGGSGGGGGSQNIFDQGNQQGRDQQEGERDELVINLLSLIRDTVGDPLDWVANGGDISSAYELSGRMVIRTTGKNHSSIRKLLNDFREFRSIAISIESRILLVDENFMEEIGVDFDMQITDLGDNWTPITIGQNSIEMAQRGSNASPATPARFSGSDTIAGPQTFFSVPAGVTDADGGVPGARAMDFSVGFLDDISVNLIVHATQANQRSAALTAPRVTFLNGTSATVVISEQIAYVQDLQVVPNAAAFDPDIGVVNSGVVLAVEGAVSSDRRYVTMNIWPSLSSVRSPIRQVPFTGSVNTNQGGDGGENITIGAFIEAPETTLTQVRTQVSVPDQGTLLLGGQRMASEIEIEAGVPVLSKVPFLKRLFTNNSTVKDERTLLILVRPTILLQNEQEDRFHPGISSDPLGYTQN